MKKQIKGSLSIIVATVIWGTAFVAQSIGMDHIGPFTFQAVRCLMAVLVLLPIIAVSDKVSGKNFWRSWCDPTLWKAGFLCGAPLFIAVNLQQMGIVDTDAGKSAFLTAMYIVLVPILGIFLKKKPSVMVPVSVAQLKVAENAGRVVFRRLSEPPKGRSCWAEVSQAYTDTEVIRSFLECCNEYIDERPYLEKALVLPRK